MSVPSKPICADRELFVAFKARISKKMYPVCLCVFMLNVHLYWYNEEQQVSQMKCISLFLMSKKAVSTLVVSL